MPPRWNRGSSRAGPWASASRSRTWCSIWPSRTRGIIATPPGTTRTRPSVGSLPSRWGMKPWRRSATTLPSSTSSMPRKSVGPSRGSSSVVDPMNLPGTLAALLISLPLAGQAWPTFFSAYEDGLAAQGRGEHALAARAFARAIALNPHAGKGVRTYGLNFLATYHPYLRLAEVQCALGDLDAAGAALQQSAAMGGEPPAEREALVGKLRALR